MKRSIVAVILLSLVLSLLTPAGFAEDNESDQTIEVNGQIIKINPNGTARGTPEKGVPEQGYKQYSLRWKGMDLFLTTEIPSNWEFESAKTGWQVGFTFQNEKVLMFYFYANAQNLIDQGIPADSDYLIDALLAKCVGNNLNNGYHHIKLAGRKAGYSLMFTSDGTACLFFTILNGNKALFLTVTDSNNFVYNTEETMDIVLHSLLSLTFSELESYAEVDNGYSEVTMKWDGMNFMVTTEVPSGWEKEIKVQGWQVGYSLYKNYTKLVNLFYFYAGNSNIVTDDIADNPQKIIEAIYNSALGTHEREIINANYAGHDAGRTKINFSNGTPGIFVVILNGDHTLYLLAEVSSDVDYDDAVRNIIDHSLETLVFSEVE